MDQATRFDTLNLGGFPVIHAYFGFLKVADSINKVVPWDGEIPLGILTEILMANRLLQPKPMYRIGQWAQRSPCGRCCAERVALQLATRGAAGPR